MNPVQDVISGYPLLESIRADDLQDRVVIVRVDYNIPASPIETDAAPKATDDYRLRASLPTLQWLIKHGARVVLLTHRGRPQGQARPELSTLSLAEMLGDMLGQDVVHVPDCVGRGVEQAVADLPGGRVLMLENTRFHLGELMNQQKFLQQLGRLGDVFINEAFPALHRAHASLSGMAAQMPRSLIGLRLQQELGWLKQLENTAHGPLAVILGGNHTGTQMGQQFELLQRLLGRVETIMLAGTLGLTFLAARDIGLGISRYEPAYIEPARNFLAEAGVCGCKVLLPTDFYTVDRAGGTELRSSGRIPAHEGAMTIGPQTLMEWQACVAKAGRLLWLETLGQTAQATNMEMARAVQGMQGFSLVGGEGLLTDFSKEHGFLDGLPQVSSGNAVILAALSGQSLPALQVLNNRDSNGRLRPEV